MIRNTELVSDAIAMIGQPYWFGTNGQLCTEELLQKKRRQYPSHYTDSRMPRYRRDIADKRICTDCFGMIEYLAERPDTTANSAYKNATDKGPISTLPEQPGIILHKDGHAGIYIGGGYAVEARGFSYGVVKTKVRDRGWQHWFRDSHVVYSDGPVSTRPTLKLGHFGDVVKEMQTLLTAHHYALPLFGADGDFGPETDVAVRMFQKDKKLIVDGIVGSATWEVLEASVKETKSYKYLLLSKDGKLVSTLQSLYGGTVMEVEE